MVANYAEGEVQHHLPEVVRVPSPRVESVVNGERLLFELLPQVQGEGFLLVGKHHHDSTENVEGDGDIITQFDF